MGNKTELEKLTEIMPGRPPEEWLLAVLEFKVLSWVLEVCQSLGHAISTRQEIASHLVLYEKDRFFNQELKGNLYMSISKVFMLMADVMLALAANNPVAINKSLAETRDAIDEFGEINVKIVKEINGDE